MPTTFCSAIPSMNQRSGISCFISSSRPGLRSDPINTTRGSFFASLCTQSRQALRMFYSKASYILAIVFREGNSFALYRVTDDRGRAIVINRKALENLLQLAHVMPIDFQGCEPE